MSESPGWPHQVGAAPTEDTTAANVTDTETDDVEEFSDTKERPKKAANKKNRR